MKPVRLAAILLATLPLAGAALAGELQMPRGVIELFTSQGCSSCPKADAAFQRLAAEPDVIALSFHVDYWNYLGWKDTMSTPENTRRQYDYAAGLGRSNVYTPQVIVNGRDHMNGSDLPAIRSQVEDLGQARKGLDVPIAIERDDDCIRISVGSGQGSAHVSVAYYTPEQQVRIEQGENAGKTITYRNVVTSLETIGMWEGEPIKLMLPSDVLGKKGRERAVILVQQEGKDGALGPIRGAALIPAAGS